MFMTSFFENGKARSNAYQKEEEGMYDAVF